MQPAGVIATALELLGAASRTPSQEWVGLARERRRALRVLTHL